MKSQVQALVIGGGVLGAGVRCHLAKQSWKYVTMIYATVLAGATLVHQAAGWIDGGLCFNFEKFIPDGKE